MWTFYKGRAQVLPFSCFDRVSEIESCFWLIQSAGENVPVKGASMTDFTTNIDMNVRMMNEKLRVDRNFDILQRDVLIGGKRTHFYFIDGFVQEETIEKLVQFFYSLKESDIKDIDTFLEVGMPYTEIEKTDITMRWRRHFFQGRPS